MNTRTITPAKLLLVFMIGLVPFCFSGGVELAQAQNANALLRETNRFGQLFNDHKYEEYIEQAPRFLEGVRNTVGENTLPYVEVMSFLGKSYAEVDRYEEAERALQEVVAVYERHSGPSAKSVAPRLNDLVQLYAAMGRYRQAQELSSRALAILERTRDASSDPEVATGVDNLAAVLQLRGHYGEAEPLRKRALSIREKAVGSDQPAFALSLYGLGWLYSETGRFGEAEPLLARALVIQEKSRDPNNHRAITALQLAKVRLALHRFSDAEVVLASAEKIMEREWGSNSKHYNDYLDMRAQIYSATNRAGDAEKLYRNSLEIGERAFGRDHYSITSTLVGLATLLRNRGEYVEAEALLRRALRNQEAAFGVEHPDVARIATQLAVLRLARGDTTGSLELARQAASGFTKVLAKRGDGRSYLEVESLRLYLNSLLHVFEHAEADGSAKGDSASEAIKVAQLSTETAAAVSLNQMAARIVGGTDKLASLARELQDTSGELQSVEKAVLEEVTKSPGEKKGGHELLLRRREVELVKQAQNIEARLAVEFPDYAASANPRPLDISEIQDNLQNDEAVVYFLDTTAWKPLPDATFVWVIAKKEVRWAKIGIGSDELQNSVQSLRCGLDATLWQDASAWPDATEEQAKRKADQIARKMRCEKDFPSGPTREVVETISYDILPFDANRAYSLYNSLLGPFDKLIAGKRLIFVPSGPLSTLPFNVLVTKPPKGSSPLALADYRQIEWLGLSSASSVLPSIASLKALRQSSRRNHAIKPYLGIGNPLLEGRQNSPLTRAFYAKLAQEARDKHCESGQMRFKVAETRGVGAQEGFAELFRGANADIEKIRQWPPLPETADELCEVAARLGAPVSDVLIGSRATENTIKDYSESGQLAQYRVIHFATHGALNGQVHGLAEPGLILTPPPVGTNSSHALDRDDGFLTASEIATLKLNADWVILSACNTAGAQNKSGEALSGMARAFFYAGARALLVSHWEVGSNAAVRLTTTAFAQLAQLKGFGRAEALRLSMRDLLKSGSPMEAHPSLWAPFVIVGEGLF